MNIIVVNMGQEYFGGPISIATMSRSGKKRKNAGGVKVGRDLRRIGNTLPLLKW
jgi:hypothetical protein